jgi:hypothetical protein
MKELIHSINASAERLYYLTRGKNTMCLEYLEILQDVINFMIEDIEEAKKEAKHLYDEIEKEEG